MTAAAQRVQFALGKAAQLFADLGGTDDLAEMFQEDALSAEVIFKGNLLGMGCDMLPPFHSEVQHQHVVARVVRSAASCAAVKKRR